MRESSIAVMLLLLRRRFDALTLRWRDALDAIRGRMGKTVDPMEEAGPRGEAAQRPQP